MGQDAAIENANESQHLSAVGAVWSDGPDIGSWIVNRLGPFGPTVGHAVPYGYAGYAVAPLWPEGDPSSDEGPSSLATLLGVFARSTGAQPVHCGIWEGFGWLHDLDEDPRTAPGMGVGVFWPLTHEPTPQEIERARAEGQEHLARDRVARPTLAPLDLPHRSYHLWTGPLAAAMAFDHQGGLPSLIWPEDRSWFLGLPIYTNEVAIAAEHPLIDAVLTDPRLMARPATVEDELDIDD